MKRIVFVVVICILCGQVFAQDNQADVPVHAGSPDPVEAWSVLLDRLAAQQNLSAKERMELQLMYLAQVQYEGLFQEYYRQMIERLRPRVDAASLPALEAFLNADIWDWREKVRPEWTIMGGLRPQVSDLWFEADWETLDDAGRITKAMKGLRPDSPVRVEPEQAIHWLKKADQAAARQTVYATLMDPELTYKSYGWTVRMIEQLRVLLADPAFAPTPQELEAAKSAGEFGTVVWIYYLAHAQPRDARPMLEQWVKTHWPGEPAKVYHALFAGERFAALPGPERRQFAQAVIDLGGKVQAAITAGSTDSYVFGLLYQTNFVLRKLEMPAVTSPHFEQYQAFRKTIDLETLRQRLDERYLGGLIGSLDAADAMAREAIETPQH